MRAKRQRKRWDWARQAACKGLPTSIFIEPTLRKDREVALKVCRHCPVAEECLNYAIVHEKRGIWGGKIENEISALRKTNLESLGYRAFREGWLEEPNLVPPRMIEDFQEYQTIAKQQRKNQSNHPVGSLHNQPLPSVDLSDLDFRILELGASPSDTDQQEP